MEELELALSHVVAGIQLAIELTGGVIIVWGCLVTTIDLLWRAAARQSFDFTRSRLRLGRHLALALEYQLAADILATAFSPSWEQLGKLAAVAAIRTGLNFFLSLEIERSESAAAAAGARTLGAGAPGAEPGQRDGTLVGPKLEAS